MVKSIGYLHKVIPLAPLSTAVNQPASGWFLFPLRQTLEKMCFMLRCNDITAGNVYPELAT